MGTTNDNDAAIAELTAMVTEMRPDQPLIVPFVERYYRELPDEDIEDRPLTEAAMGALAHFDLGRRRMSGEVLVDMSTPDLERDGWAPNRSVLMLVTDDVPFLVDTVRMILDRHGLGIDLLIHPTLTVQRDDDEITGFDAVTQSQSRHEAWTQIQLDRCDPDTQRQVEREVRAAIDAVMQIVEDFPAMQARLAGAAAEGRGQDELIAWLASEHFVFLAAASYRRTTLADGTPDLELIEGSELGEYRPESALDAREIWPPSKPGDPFDEPLVIARTEALATIHRASRMTSVAVRVAGDDTGDVIEHRFVGLLGSGAYRESIFAIPVLRDRASDILALSHATSVGHTARAIKNVVETLPRDLVFELDGHTLAQLVIDIVGLQERRIVRVFHVTEPVGGFSTVFVYLPKARFDSGLQAQVADLVGRFAATDVRDVSSLVDASSLARISMTVTHFDPTGTEELTDLIDAETASWAERARSALISKLGDDAGGRVFEAVHAAIPTSYSSRVHPDLATGDLERVAKLFERATTAQPDDEPVGAWLDTSLTRGPDGGWRFRIFRCGTPSTIADLVPLLGHLGLHAVDEHPSVFELSTGRVHLYDIGVRVLRPAEAQPAEAQPPEAGKGGGDFGAAVTELSDRQNAEVQSAFRALVRGEAEADGLHRLVLAADLTVRSVAVLRSYSRYLQQAGFPFSQAYIEEVLVRLAPVAHSLAALFDARFDPRGEPSPNDSPIIVNATRADILRRLDEVPSLDDDRICRALLTLIDATTRTNAFQRRGDGALHEEIALKLDAQSIPFLPQPRPMFEIFVCSPKVEGVHLRAGKVSRGGLRWSDRREDYRTEVLGLVKAQMVKNAVIVPVGAKGGFVVKQPTAPARDRDAQRAEGIDRYQRFVGSLLHVTDNLATVDGTPTVVHPADTIIYDEDDPYLVVAADKGTATFSDIANQIAVDAGFWLGDAFASGGSNGYDHKAMGITARGAWESVRRHARVIGVDIATDEITVVGVGDMSGDVFGNGMLLSSHLRLVAAFDHRDIFLDPDPDPATSFAERQRLFELPRSSWVDYDIEKISAGGGVHSRSSKSIPLSSEVRRVLGLDDAITEMAPNALMTAILSAPVDLLWNGGIGTYVKASHESHEDVGDRANDAIRVDGAQLRCKIVGEGGNLGLTQSARVEYAIGGGLIYTDAIDNSAGVDCSDHEVNIKIALDQLVAGGTLTVAQRNELLAEMTDEVAELVLDDNRAQTLALMIARTQSLSMVNVHARYLDSLEAEGHIDRALENLPNDKQIAERQTLGSGLRAPEFAVMIASTKNADIGAILATDLPDDPSLEGGLLSYFPTALRERHPAVLLGHRLRREIITTDLVNNMVNLAGISFDHRMTEQSGVSVADVARAYVASRDIVDFQARWAEVEVLGTSVDLDTQIAMFLDVRQMAERATSWLLRRRPAPLDISSTVAEFLDGFTVLDEGLNDMAKGRVKRDISRARDVGVDAGVSPELAARSARLPWLHASFDIVEVARRERVEVLEAGAAYWEVFEAFDIGWMWDGIGALPRADRWQTQARASLRDDLMSVLAELTGNVLRTAGGSAMDWITTNEASFMRVVDMETEIRRAEPFDLTIMSVAVRQLRNLTVTTSG